MNFGWTAPFGVFGAGGGVKRPALINSILQWLTKYVGGSIPFTDKVDPRLDSPDVTEVSCVTMNGTTSYVTVPFRFEDVEGDIDFSFWIKPASLVHGRTIFNTMNENASSRGVYMEHFQTSGVVYLRMADGSGTWNVDTITAVGALAVGEWRKINFTFNRTTLLASVVVTDTDGATTGSLSATANTATWADDKDLVLMASSVFINGSAGDIAYVKEESTFLIPLDEGEGTIAYDTTDNLIDGSIIDGVWTTGSGIDCYNLLGGHTLYTDSGLVSVSEFYNNAKMTFAHTVDDYEESKISEFNTAFDASTSYNIPTQVGSYAAPFREDGTTPLLSPTAIENLQEYIDNSEVSVCSHSLDAFNWSTMTEEDLPYAEWNVNESKRLLEEAFILGPFYEYNGAQTLLGWVQSYGAAGAFQEEVSNFVKDAGYIIDVSVGIDPPRDYATWAPYNDNYPEWFNRVERFSSGASAVVVNDAFDIVYANSGVMAFLVHPGSQVADYLPGGRADLIFQHCSGKPDVWYETEDRAFMYRYLMLKGIDSVDITDNGTSEYLVAVNANAEARDRYSLSYPMTYRCEAPSGKTINKVSNLESGGTFDGVGNSVTIDTPIVLSGDFLITVTGQFDVNGTQNLAITSDASAFDVIAYGGSGVQFFRVRIGGTWYDGVGGGSSLLFDGNRHELIVQRIGSNVSFTIDGGTPEVIIATSGDIDVTKLFQYGGGANRCKGWVSDINVDDQVHYNFTGNKNTTVATDLTTNGNDGTIILGAGTIEDFWADTYVGMLKKSDTDVFSGINAYRIDGTDGHAYTSQSLPESSNTLNLKVEYS